MFDDNAHKCIAVEGPNCIVFRVNTLKAIENECYFTDLILNM